eukprot:8120864-Ditylum_brightwellii.AAC.1
MFGLSYTTTLVPGAARGVTLKSNAPFICASADKYGFSHDEPMRLRRDTTGKWPVRLVKISPGPGCWS